MHEPEGRRIRPSAGVVATNVSSAPDIDRHPCSEEGSYVRLEDFCITQLYADFCITQLYA
jgi:hypothetical protein